MPEICRFFGIVIAMYYKEHMPPTSTLSTQGTARHSRFRT